MVRVSFNGLALSILKYMSSLARLDFVPGKWLKFINNYLNLGYVHDAAL